MKLSENKNLYIGIFLVVFSAALRIYGMGWGLPELYEEATPLKQGLMMWKWGSGKGPDLNPHFFHYPSLTLYIHFITQGLFYRAMNLWGLVNSTLDFQVLYTMHKTPIILAGRSIAIIFGVSSILLVYILSRGISGLKAAAAAALLLSINTLHITRSQMIEVDTPLTFFTLLFMWYAIRVLKAPTFRNYLLAGMALGLAASTKYTGVMLVLPLITAHILSWRSSIKQTGTASHTNRTNHGLVLLSLLAAFLVFFITSPYVLIDFRASLKDIMFERGHMSYGYFGMGSLPTWVFYLDAMTGRLLGWPIAVSFFVGFFYLTFIERKYWAIIIASFLVPYLFAINSWAMRADRYLLPVMPLIILFACAWPLELPYARNADKAKAMRLGFRFFLVIMAFPLILKFPAHFRELGADSRTEAKKWIERNIPSDSFILLEEYGPELLSATDILALPADIRKVVLRERRNKPRYAVLRLPMYQVNPQLSSVFYDFSFYRFVDYIITSGSVQSRYSSDPERYNMQISFYDSLDSRFQKIKVFPLLGRLSSTITIYKNPIQKTPFGKRENVQIPHELRKGIPSAKGDRARFYFKLGMNFESFNHYKSALEIYKRAFMFKIYPDSWYWNLALGSTRCLVSMGHPGRAVEFLEQAAGKAPSREIASDLLGLKEQVKKRYGLSNPQRPGRLEGR